MTGLAYPMWAGLTPGSRVSVTADATLREARGSRGREEDGEEGILGWERGILGGRERGREGGILGGGGGGGGGRFVQSFGCPCFYWTTTHRRCTDGLRILGGPLCGLD